MLIDNYFAYWIESDKEFMQVGSVTSHQIIKSNNASSSIAEVIVRIDQRSVKYQRTTDTVVSGLEAIGGFQESIMHIGFMMVFFFQERLFKGSFLKQLY